MDTRNKTILITGASGGIGAAIARRLAATDARLILVGRNQSALEQSLSLLPANDFEAEHQIIRADINSEVDRQTILKSAKELSVDIVINNAGVLDFNMFEQQTDAEIKNLLITNLLSPILLCRALIPILKQREKSVIINIGSTFGSIGHPGFVTYCASKFGLRGFSEALSRELADTSIDVRYLAPRATKTTLNSSAVNALNIVLKNKTDSPEYVADELLKLLSSRRIECFIGWPEKLFVRVNGLFPKVVHDALVKKLDVIKSHIIKSGV